MSQEPEDGGDGRDEPPIDAPRGGVEPFEDGQPGGQSGGAADRNAQEGGGVSTAMQKLQAENTELAEKYERLLAEMEAHRQRTGRDKEEFKKYALSGFAGDMLAVADNLCRALEVVPKDLLATVPALQAFVDGVEATERILLNALNRHQVTRFNPLGEPFNPHLHDAKFNVNKPDVPANTVVQVLSAGYMIGERVLRPAEVAVSQSVQQTFPARDVQDDEDTPVLFRRHGPDSPGAGRDAPRPEATRQRPSSIMQKAVISASDGIPAATHPIWERLVTGQIEHRFGLFAANLLVDRARREYANNRNAKARLAREICTFCNRNASLVAADLEPVISAAGKIPPANHPVWELLATGRIKHRFKLFAANLLVDRAKRAYAMDSTVKAALASELCKFFNEHADLTAPEFETIAWDEKHG
jgi:molecular chaperone GrpE